ncbi:uncharacterized protein LOC128607359 isoform X1 [Ictalurus furcatus]|uniref:uncharacterized protein LOC128607359 isoform X1 n=1 Tax=Ictalurus furcatus TaxID=66913 RepID=UPI00234FD7F5|nr:uncharacterized protein LOC128607359 isoform X1 [Ictalurus furcatus]
MGSLGDDEQLDEVHCLWALCPHPCCWEAERRIAGGVYRRAVRLPTKHRANVEESFPSLAVVDVSEWAETRTVSSGSRIPSQAVPPRKDATPRVKTTDPAFPAITSAAAKSHTRGSGTVDKGDNTAHISPLIGSPWGSGSLVLWVPNPHYIPQCLESSKPLHCAVKEFVCLPDTAQTQNAPKANRKGATKNWRFQLTRSPLTFQPSQRAESGQLEVGAGDASAAAVNEPEVRRDPSAFLVTNKPVVFHSARDRTDRTASRDAPASRYKLDSKTGREDVDWDSLREQSYLWKRHHVPPELLSPPGGARGAQETASSSPVSRVSSDRPLHSPQCAAWPCVKRTLRYGRYTHPLLFHKKHHRGTGSELDMTICSTSALTEHNQLHRVRTQREREREREREL